MYSSYSDDESAHTSSPVLSPFFYSLHDLRNVARSAFPRFKFPVMLVLMNILFCLVALLALIGWFAIAI